MALSDEITRFILDILEESKNGTAELKRNELAGHIGCVPSQINYVLSSRFTPQQGYIVESQRGGGGYIRITRIQFEKNEMLMHTVASIGETIDFNSAKAILHNLIELGQLNVKVYNVIISILNPKNYSNLSKEEQEKLNAIILKTGLIAVIGNH